MVLCCTVVFLTPLPTRDEFSVQEMKKYYIVLEVVSMEVVTVHNGMHHQRHFIQTLSRLGL